MGKQMKNSLLSLNRITVADLSVSLFRVIYSTLYTIKAKIEMLRFCMLRFMV